MLCNILGGVIIIGVGLAIYPVVNTTIADASTNISGSAQTIVSLIVPFFALAVLASVIGITISGLRTTGLIGGKYKKEYETDFEEKLAENPDHKQTYYEYCQERLAVEKMIKHN